jgi:hypothetical protein
MFTSIPLPAAGKPKSTANIKFNNTEFHQIGWPKLGSQGPAIGFPIAGDFIA